MKRLSVRAIFLALVISCIAIGMAYGDDVTVIFPSDSSFSCNISACDFLGNLSHQSEWLYSTGDFVTEIFFTGQPGVIGLKYDFFVLDYLTGNPGVSYKNDIYINDTIVGSIFIPDCNYCGSTLEFKGEFDFPYVEGDGTYALSIVFAETVPPGDASVAYLAGGSATLVATPEPGSLVLLGSGALGLMGMMRRKWIG